MNNLNKLNGWAGDSGYASRTSAQSYMASDTIKMASSCGSSCGSKDGEEKPASSCGTGDSEPKPSSCGAGDSKPASSCGASEGDAKPKTSSCGSSCGSGGK